MHPPILLATHNEFLDSFGCDILTIPNLLLSLDLAPSNYHLFTLMNVAVFGERYEGNEQLKGAMEKLAWHAFKKIATYLSS